MTPSPLIETASSLEALASRAAAFIAQRISEAPGRFALCLSGGSTPRPVYERLGSGQALDPHDWQKVHLFWGDERYVPQDHRDSNFRMAREALIGRVAIPPAQVHPVPTDCATPLETAASYEAALQNFYGASTLDPARPLFDMTLLGLGEDGHIASLFPGTAALGERRAWVTAVSGARPEPRITLTFPAIESSREIVFLVSGEGKRDILARVLADGASLPAARLHAQGAIRIFVDRAALPG